MNPGGNTPATSPTESLLRRCFLGLGAASAVGIAIELGVSRHWSTRVQLIPWVSLVVVLAAIALVARMPTPRTLVAGRIAAVAVLLASGYGVLDHATANHHVAPLDAAFSDRWDSMSWLSQWWAATTGAVGPAPTFAPGALGLAAAALIAFTLHHPQLASAASPLNGQRARDLGRSGLTAVLLGVVTVAWAGAWLISGSRDLLRRSALARRVAIAAVFLAGIGFSQWLLAQDGSSSARQPGAAPAALTTSNAGPAIPVAPAADQTVTATTTTPPSTVSPPTTAAAPPQTAPAPARPAAQQSPPRPSPASPAPRPATPATPAPAPPAPTTTSDDDGSGRGRGRGRGRGGSGGDDD